MIASQRVDSVQAPSELASELSGGSEDTSGVKVPLAPGQWAELLEALEARGPGQAVSVVLRGEAPGAWPEDAQIEKLVSLGCVEVEVPWVMELGERQAEQSVHFVRFLRDCTSHRLKVRWRGAARAPVTAWTLFHLEPPESGGLPELEEAAERWKRAHQYGRCYWRAGPGFVLVKDRREGRDAAQFVLDEPATRNLFQELRVPRHEETLGAGTRDALGDLWREELVMNLGAWWVALPFRIRTWPVPFVAV